MSEVYVVDDDDDDGGGGGGGGSDGTATTNAVCLRAAVCHVISKICSFEPPHTIVAKQSLENGSDEKRKVSFSFEQKLLVYLELKLLHNYRSMTPGYVLFQSYCCFCDCFLLEESERSRKSRKR